MISGRASHLERMQRLLAEHGADPQHWLPAFMRARAASSDFQSSSSQSGGSSCRAKRPASFFRRSCGCRCAGCARPVCRDRCGSRDAAAVAGAALEQQLATARSQLAQAQAQFQSTTGSRGMQSLLGGTVRNYLPPDWATLPERPAGRAGGTYPALTADLHGPRVPTAVLTPQQLAALPAGAGQSVAGRTRGRGAAPIVSHAALANSSSASRRCSS